MKKMLLCLLALTATALSAAACFGDEPGVTPDPPVVTPDDPDTPDDPKILVAYFSWGGTTQRVAEQIGTLTGADLFRIEPVTPYPADYTECTEVALQERDTNARPAIRTAVEGMDGYDIVFIGCPVWWHTAPMIIGTFAESYDLRGKTVVPFCTYASTYRDETLARIVELTPGSDHLEGFGSTGSTADVADWLQRIGVM